MSPWLPALLVLAGAVTGLLGTVLGIGGGVFLVPALVLWLKTPLPQAVSAGLICVIATSCASASANVEKGLVNIDLGVTLETATVFGALCGAWAAPYLPARLLLGLFACLLAAVSALLWRPLREHPECIAENGGLGGDYFDEARRTRVRYSVRRLASGLGASYGAGALSALLGVGGGVVKVPALHLLCGVPIKAAAATSNFMIGATAAASAALYFRRGQVEPLLGGTLALGVLGGSLLGRRANARLRDHDIRKGFSLLTAFLALQLLRRAWHG